MTKNAEAQKRWRLKNLDKAVAASTVRTQKWRQNNPERRRKQARDYGRKRQGLPAPTRPEPACCETCGRRPDHALCLDHDHATGEFRGWLCKSCNLALGYAKDSPTILRRLAEYLDA